VTDIEAEEHDDHASDGNYKGPSAASVGERTTTTRSKNGKGSSGESKKSSDEDGKNLFGLFFYGNTLTGV